MKVAFRTDASILIGSGHVMRCLTLARELRLTGAEVSFICRELPGHCNNLILKEGFEVVPLPFDALTKNSQGIESQSGADQWLAVPWEQDAEQCHQILAQQSSWDWLIVDHYGIDQAWEEYQRDVVNKIMVIDDLADRNHNCDLLLDQNLYADMASRYGNKVPDHCRQLLGPDYVLLRKEFLEQRKIPCKRNGHVRRILVFFGGVDATNMTALVIGAIRGMNLDDIKVDIVIGAANPYRDKLMGLLKNISNVELHVQVTNMAELMANADLCVGAGGTATWERCCLGLPSIAWPVAENQEKVLHDAASAGLVYAPDIYPPSIEEISVHLRALIGNSRLCHYMGVRGMEYVDGRGASRVVKKLMAAQFTLRFANPEDVLRVYDWRNDKRVRRYSHDSEEIDFEDHQRWFKQVLDDPNRLLLIGSVDGLECGVLRYDIADNRAEVSIYLAPEQLGKGYGKPLLDAGDEYLAKNRVDVDTIVAEILSENRVSQNLFKSCGYMVSVTHYTKRLHR